MVRGSADYVECTHNMFSHSYRHNLRLLKGVSFKLLPSSFQYAQSSTMASISSCSGRSDSYYHPLSIGSRTLPSLSLLIHLKLTKENGDTEIIAGLVYDLREGCKQQVIQSQ